MQFVLVFLQLQLSDITGFPTVATFRHLMSPVVSFPSCNLYQYRISARPVVTCTPNVPFWIRTPSSIRPLRKSHVTNFSLKERDDRTKAPSSVVSVSSNETDVDQRSSLDTDEGHSLGTQETADSEEQSDEENVDDVHKQKQQEVDWKADEEFKKFMGNPSIEAAIKLEKKMADRKLQELNREYDPNPVSRFFKNAARARLVREKKWLEKAEEAFKALDINELRSCFGFDSFFAVDARRFRDGGIFVGNLRKPIDEVIPKLEKKLSEAAGREVALWFMEEKKDDATKQVCVVQPKSELDLQFESTTLSTPWGYVSALALAVTTFGTIALMSGFFLKLDATFDDYVANVLPLFGGFLSILGVSEDLHTRMKIGGGYEGADGLFYLDQLPRSEKAAVVSALSASVSALQWHYRLGHPSSEKLRSLVPDNDSCHFQCDSCQLGKQTLLCILDVVL